MFIWLIYMLSRATGWAESELWGMSYAKALMLLHCHLLSQGQATRWAHSTAEERAVLDEQLEAFLL